MYPLLHHRKGGGESSGVPSPLFQMEHMVLSLWARDRYWSMVFKSWATGMWVASRMCYSFLARAGEAPFWVHAVHMAPSPPCATGPSPPPEVVQGKFLPCSQSLEPKRLRAAALLGCSYLYQLGYLEGGDD